MKIYTGFGDQGKTRLYGGEVVSKDHPRIETYGTLDELNSWLGLINTAEKDTEISDTLKKIQTDIFNISSLIACPTDKERSKLNFKAEDISFQFIEKFIDKINVKLPPLQNFILPGGSQLSSFYHISRTICRRAERKLIQLVEKDEIENKLLVYLNRLSDLLFVLARYANLQNNINDVLWNSK